MTAPDESGAQRSATPDGRAGPAVTRVVVDAANVIGSRPDGWWRDRAGAARRFAGELVALLVERREILAEAVGADGELVVHLVLEGAAGRVVDLPTHPQLQVHRAPADGDSAIPALAGELDGDVVVVTADRGLRARVGAVGARVTGPATLLGALPDP
ncbi:MAG: hypothetical protein AB7J32_11850 [Pseudonocardia sp.]